MTQEIQPASARKFKIYKEITSHLMLAGKFCKNQSPIPQEDKNVIFVFLKSISSFLPQLMESSTAEQNSSISADIKTNLNLVTFSEISINSDIYYLIIIYNSCILMFEQLQIC